MEPFNEEQGALFIGKALDTLLTNTVNLEKYLKNQPFTTNRDPEELRKLFEKFKESNKDCLKRIEDCIEECGIDYINKTWYNLQDFSNFEDEVVNHIYYENIMEKIFFSKIRTTYHILKLHMIAFHISSEKVDWKFKNKKINSVFKILQTFVYLHCELFLDALLAYSKMDGVNLKKILDENPIGEYTPTLSDFRSKNKKSIKRAKKEHSDLFAKYVF